MASKRRVRDYIVHDTKERPSARSLIEREGLTPQILGDSSARYWDGHTVRDKDGRRTPIGGDTLTKQIAKMAAWGEFGDEVANAFMDWERYHYIQDRLLEWPDPKLIEKEALHVFDPMQGASSTSLNLRTPPGFEAGHYLNDGAAIPRRPMSPEAAMSSHAWEDNMMVTDRLLSELERQQKYLDRLPKDFQFPLFNAKTAVESQRQNGYRNTASAARELVDNAIEAGATRVDIILERARGGGRADSVSAVACIDNGAGMGERMVRYALSWGGGTHFDDPAFIGKFGFGLPNASINQTRHVDVYTRAKGSQEVYRAWLNLDEADDFGIQRIPEPTLGDLPDFVKKYLDDKGLTFEHGTTVVWVRPDRLTYRTGASLKEHMLDDFGVTYRYLLDNFELYVEGVRVEMVDPLFLDSRSRYYVAPEDGGAVMPEPERAIPVRYYQDPETGGKHLAKIDETTPLDTNDPNLLAVGNIAVKIARFPYEFAKHKKGKKETDAHRRFDIRSSRRGMTFVRAGREIETVDAFPRSKRDEASGLGQWPLLQGYAYHWGIEVKFDPTLDDVFGITNDKQRVRPVEDFWRLMHKEEIDRLLRAENAWQAKERRDKNKAKAEESPEPTPGEQAAAAVSTITGKVPRPPEHQHRVATEHLEEAAKVRAKVTKESIEQARKAVEQDKKRRPYVITYFEDARGPFFVPEWSGSQILIKINKSHPFFDTLYGDVLRLPGGRRSKEAIDVLLIALGRAELLTEDETGKLWYERQRTDVWSPFLADALKVLAQTLQSSEEPEEGEEFAVA